LKWWRFKPSWHFLTPRYGQDYTNNAYVAATYSAAYRVIFNANNILANIGVVVAADKAKVTAEAKFRELWLILS
jgi:hypothetical protein